MATALSCVLAAQKANAAVGPLALNPAAQVARVKTCYRIALKVILADYGPMHKVHFWEKMQLADDVRNLFERNRHIKDPAKIDQLINQAYEFIKSDQLLAGSTRYQPIMSPGGTSWERNIPAPISAVEQHAQTESELLESWERYDDQVKLWKQQDAEFNPDGVMLDQSEQGWTERLPKMAALATQLLSQLPEQLDAPVTSRLGVLTQNINLDLEVHEAIPNNESLQFQLGDGPLPYVRYTEALAAVRALAEAAKAQGTRTDISAVLNSVPKVDVEALSQGVFDTPESRASWSKVKAFQVLGALSPFSGLEEQAVLKTLSLDHIPANNVEQWVKHSAELQLLVSAAKDPFEQVNKLFMDAPDPALPRDMSELRAEAERLLRAYASQGVDDLMDTFMRQLRHAMQEQKRHSEVLRTWDVVSASGVILTPYEEYLHLHRATQYAERVLGRVFPRDGPLDLKRFHFGKALYQSGLIYPEGSSQTVGMSGFISPRPLPNLPQYQAAIWLDYIRMVNFHFKLRDEHMTLGSRADDEAWLQEYEQDRVGRYQKFVADRRTNLEFQRLFGVESVAALDCFEPDLRVTLNVSDIPETLTNNHIIPSNMNRESNMDLKSVFHEHPHTLHTEYPEDIDQINTSRQVQRDELNDIKAEFAKLDLSGSNYATYATLYDLVPRLRQIERDEELRRMQFEYRRAIRQELLGRRAAVLDNREWQTI